MGGLYCFLGLCVAVLFLNAKIFMCIGRRGFRGFHAKGADGFAKGKLKVNE